MSFTYDPAHLDQPLNQLRLKISDTDESEFFFQDEEINYVHGEQPNLNLAAAILCRSIAARLAKETTVEDPAIKSDAQAQANVYLKLAKDFEEKGRAEKERLEDQAASSSGVSGFTKLSGKPATFTRDLHLNS